MPCQGHAILFGRSIAAVLPDDLPGPLALAVLDVCGAPALTSRVVAAARPRRGAAPVGGRRSAAAGKSGIAVGGGGRGGPGRAAVIGVVPQRGARPRPLRAAAAWPTRS